MFAYLWLYVCYVCLYTEAFHICILSVFYLNIRIIMELLFWINHIYCLVRAKTKYYYRTEQVILILAWVKQQELDPA